MGITNSSGIKNSINNRQINQVEKNDVEERRFIFMLGEKIIIKVVGFFWSQAWNKEIIRGGYLSQ